MRKVHVTVQVKLVLLMDEGLEVGEALEKLEIGTTRNESRFDVDDHQILGHEVTDSK